MTQQLLTLPEIRTLLARQADDNPEDVQQYYDDRVVSHEAGKVYFFTFQILKSMKYSINSFFPQRLLDTEPLPDVQASKVGVSDVISSVRSIMASEMAQRSQQENLPEDKVQLVPVQNQPSVAGILI